jgi:hypothetical protein
MPIMGVSKDPTERAINNIGRALETCASFGTTPSSSQDRKGADKDLIFIKRDETLPDTNTDIFRVAHPRRYKQWSGNSLQLFAYLANTVVAGTHIIEDSQLQPSVSALNCTSDEVGDIVFPNPDKGTISCPLTGKNLDKIAQLRLRNANDATDTTTAQGPVTVSGDSASGSVSFPTPALHALSQPAYTVYTVSSKGVEQKTGLTMHLSTDPFVTEISPSTIDLSGSSGAPQTLTITGYHLGNVDTVVFTDSANSKNTASIPLTLDALKKDTQLLVTLDPSKLTAFGTKQITLNVTFLIDKKASGPKTPVSLLFTGPPVPPAGKTPAKPTAAKTATTTAPPPPAGKTPARPTAAKEAAPKAPPSTAGAGKK